MKNVKLFLKFLKRKYERGELDHSCFLLEVHPKDTIEELKSKSRWVLELLIT